MYEVRFLVKIVFLKPKLVWAYKKTNLVEQSKLLKQKIHEAESILHLDELKKRKRLLRRMGYLSEKDEVEFKGKIACEIKSGDEIVLTELLLNNVFNDLSAELIAALLSCFVIDEKSEVMIQEEFMVPYDEKSDEDEVMIQEFKVPYNQILETAKMVAEISKECNIAINEHEYLRKFSPRLTESVYAWCNVSIIIINIYIHTFLF